MTLQEIDEPTRQILQTHGFEEIPFDSLRERLRSGEAGAVHNRIGGDVLPPQLGDVGALPALGSDGRRLLHERGAEALRRGEVGVVILAGGMATRFGGVVKAAVPVIDDASFLDLKLRDVEHVAHTHDARIPVYVMTSFSTDAVIRTLLKSTDRCPSEAFAQYASLRLTPHGELFRDSGGALSPYAPGHGDLPFALARAGILARFMAAGGRTLLMSNVDNLTATLDPAVIGAHLASGAAITAEMAPKEAGDQGGAPARVDGRLQIVEAFRFPDTFDQSRIPVFNTNTLTFTAEALREPHALSWFAVDKTVDDRPAVQFERLVGQLTAFVPSAFLRVERHGPDARFQPIKTPADLKTQRQPIVRALQSRGVL